MLYSETEGFILKNYSQLKDLKIQFFKFPVAEVLPPILLLPLNIIMGQPFSRPVHQSCADQIEASFMVVGGQQEVGVQPAPDRCAASVGEQTEWIEEAHGLSVMV